MISKAASTIKKGLMLVQNTLFSDFSGATLADMKDFVKPLTRRIPDELILYVGTDETFAAKNDC